MASDKGDRLLPTSFPIDKQAGAKVTELVGGGIGDPNVMRRCSITDRVHVAKQLAREWLCHTEKQQRFCRVTKKEDEQQRSGRGTSSKLKATKQTVEDGLAPILPKVDWMKEAVLLVDVCHNTIDTKSIQVEGQEIEVTNLPLNNSNAPIASIWDEKGLKMSIETIMLKACKQHPKKQWCYGCLSTQEPRISES